MEEQSTSIQASSNSNPQKEKNYTIRGFFTYLTMFVILFNIALQAIQVFYRSDGIAIVAYMGLLIFASAFLIIPVLIIGVYLGHRKNVKRLIQKSTDKHALSPTWVEILGILFGGSIGFTFGGLAFATLTGLSENTNSIIVIFQFVYIIPLFTLLFVYLGMKIAQFIYAIWNNTLNIQKFRMPFFLLLLITPVIGYFIGANSSLPEHEVRQSELDIKQQHTTISNIQEIASKDSVVFEADLIINNTGEYAVYVKESADIHATVNIDGIRSNTPVRLREGVHTIEYVYTFGGCDPFTDSYVIPQEVVFSVQAVLEDDTLSEPTLTTYQSKVSEEEKYEEFCMTDNQISPVPTVN